MRNISLSGKLSTPLFFRSFTLLFLYPVLFLGCQDEKTVEIYFDEMALAGFPVIIPANLAGEKTGIAFILKAEGKENSIYAQKWDSASLVFILDEDADAGETRNYRLQPVGNDFQESIRVDSGAGSITFLTAGRDTILTYHTQEKLPPDIPDYYRRSGFIHPLYTPKGLILTDDFPKGHIHQHGIFSAWVNTTFKGESIDFWNQQDQTGTVRHDSVILIETGPVFGRMKTAHTYMSLKFGDVLKEEWDLTIFPLEGSFLLDLSIHQVNSSEDTLYLNDYIYGGLAFRGNGIWNREDTLKYRSEMEFVTAEGKNREEGNHTRPGWVAAYGDLPGGVGGIAIIDHRANPNYPQPVRIHPEMPYFCMAPIVNNPIALSPQGSYQARYRLLSFDGRPEIAFIESIARGLNQH